MVDPLAKDGVVVLDGGMGTELEARGARMDYEAWSGLANLEDPDLVRRVHEDYIRAGADVVIANTFSTNRAALAAAGRGDGFEEANRAAVDAALSAREGVGRPVAVAGSMSPLGTVDGDGGLHGTLSEAQMLEVYGEQARLLAEAGVELIVMEMFGARWSAALRPALDTGLPVRMGTWTRGVNGGDLPAPTGRPFEQDLPALIDDRAAVLVMHSPLDAVGPALAAIALHWRGPRGAYPHAGHWKRPNWAFGDIAPSVIADRAEAWVRDGARIVGGCCGTRPDHIRAIHDRLAAS